MTELERNELANRVCDLVYENTAGPNEALQVLDNAVTKMYLAYCQESYTIDQFITKWSNALRTNIKTAYLITGTKQ